MGWIPLHSPMNHDTSSDQCEIRGGPYNSSYLIWRQGSGHTIEIYDIYVDPKYRRCGVGRQLVAELTKIAPPHIRTIFALTRPTNMIAQEFYEGIGFSVLGVLRNFYRDTDINGVDALMYGFGINEGKQL